MIKKTMSVVIAIVIMLLLSGSAYVANKCNATGCKNDKISGGSYCGVHIWEGDFDPACGPDFPEAAR